MALWLVTKRARLNLPSSCCIPNHTHCSFSTNIVNSDWPRLFRGLSAAGHSLAHHFPPENLELAVPGIKPGTWCKPIMCSANKLRPFPWRLLPGGDNLQCLISMQTASFCSTATCVISRALWSKSVSEILSFHLPKEPACLLLFRHVLCPALDFNFSFPASKATRAPALKSFLSLSPLLLSILGRRNPTANGAEPFIRCSFLAPVLLAGWEGPCTRNSLSCPF